MKVLIVEADNGERGLIRDAIRPVCSAILEASNGAQGFETAVRERPDVIIADAMMPGIGGNELLRFIRHSTLRTVPFVLFSAGGGNSADPDSAGPDTYLVSADSHEDIMSDVKDILQRVLLKKEPSGGGVPFFPKEGREWAALSAQPLSEREREKLQEDHLRQTQKMEALGTLCGGIAHDFNNILTAIIGFSNVLLMKLDNANLAPLVENIVAAADRATALTSSLLAFSRKMRIELRKIDLNTVVNDMVPVIGRLLPETVTLEVDPKSESLLVLADPGQLGQVLVNLASNSRDFMPGGGKIEIATTRVDMDNDFIRSHGFGSPGSYALLTVRDNGAGMDETTKDRMYEPFFTTKERGKGTGLGLSIVYGVVKQHQGFIMCTSQPGEGTTFDMYLPLAPQPSSGWSSGPSVSG